MSNRTLHIDHSVVEVELHDGTKLWVKHYRDGDYYNHCDHGARSSIGTEASIGMSITDAHRFRGEDMDAAKRCAEYVHGKVLNRMWEVSEE